MAQATAAENGYSSATSTAQTNSMVNGATGSTNSTIQFAAPNSTNSSASPTGLSQGAQGEDPEKDSSNLGQNGFSQAPAKTLVRETSFEERLDAIVGNLDLSEAQYLKISLSVSRYVFLF